MFPLILAVLNRDCSQGLGLTGASLEGFRIFRGLGLAHIPTLSPKLSTLNSTNTCPATQAHRDLGVCCLGVWGLGSRVWVSGCGGVSAQGLRFRVYGLRRSEFRV